MLPARRSRWRWIGGSLAGIAVIVAAIWLLWDWNWFRPLVEARLSAELGRPVTLGQLHVHPGREVEITADDVRIANPAGFDRRISRRPRR